MSFLRYNKSYERKGARSVSTETSRENEVFDSFAKKARAIFSHKLITWKNKTDLYPFWTFCLLFTRLTLLNSGWAVVWAHSDMQSDMKNNKWARILEKWTLFIYFTSYWSDFSYKKNTYTKCLISLNEHRLSNCKWKKKWNIRAAQHWLKYHSLIIMIRRVQNITFIL